LSNQQPPSPEKPVFVVSAPSGTGKTTLNRRLLAENPDVEMSVSYTARPMRAGERTGVDYHFVSREQFQDLIVKGEMLEYAEVFGKLYGTSIREIKRINGLNKTVLLEIDVQGWEKAKPRLRHAVSVFILPPSVKALWERLEKRGTEAPAVRFRRLMTAKKEIEMGHLYDYFIVNNEVDNAYDELHGIIIKGKKGLLGNAEGVALCRSLIEEFDKAAWLKKLSHDFAAITEG
jgi:guanylate kinase